MEYDAETCQSVREDRDNFEKPLLTGNKYLASP